MSTSLEEMLSAATALQDELQNKEVTPLHLFAALLAGSHSRAQAFEQADITHEYLVDLIRKEE